MSHWIYVWWLQAARELADWYEQNAVQLESLRAANRQTMLNTEKHFVSELEPIQPGTEWDRSEKWTTKYQSIYKNFLQGVQAVRFQPQERQEREGRLPDAVDHPTAEARPGRQHRLARPRQPRQYSVLRMFSSTVIILCKQ